MTRTVFTNGVIFANSFLIEAHILAIEKCRVLDIMPEGKEPPDSVIVDLEGGYLVPGFIDIQVNGGGGVHFNATPTVEGLRRIAEAHAAFGVTSLLPTIITDSDDVMERAIRAADDAIAGNVPSIIGVHLEGPYINPLRKGVHAAEQIRSPDASSVARLTSLKRGSTLVTLAPEHAGNMLIRSLADRNICVAAGHTDASYQEIIAAAEHGLSGVTHLFNAMRQFGSREPGTVGAALDCDPLFVSMIVDGHHVHPASMSAAYRCLGPNRLCLISDAMPTVGTDWKEFNLQGRRIVRENGILTTESGTLAGADIGMIDAIRNAQSMLGATFADALQMATLTPARFMGMEQDRGRITPGSRADLVWLDRYQNVCGTWIEGKRVFVG